MSAPERIWAYPSYVTGWNSANAHDRFVINSTEYIRADLLTAAQAEIARLTAERDAFRRNMRDTFDAMCAMRNSINEHLPMPSLESDLLQGPENSIFCAAVAEAVVSALTAARAERDAAMAGRVKVKPLWWCYPCRSVGMMHCSDPEHCGCMTTADAEADSWKSWLDDLPLPDDFRPGVDRLQEFITRVLANLQPDTERAEPVADAVRGVWGRCEALEDEAHAKLEGDKLTDHERGFWRGQKLAAKSIRRSTELPQPATAPQAREITVQEAAEVLLASGVFENYDCACMGPRDGEPLCPCDMRAAVVKRLRALADMQKGCA